MAQPRLQKEKITGTTLALRYLQEVESMISSKRFQIRSYYSRATTALLCCILLVSTISPALYASDDDINDGSNNPTQQSDIITKSGPRRVYEILKIAKNESLTNSDRRDAILFASKYHYREVVDQLFNILEHEVAKGTDKSNINIVLSIISALGNCATRTDHQSIMDLLDRRIYAEYAEVLTTQELLNLSMIVDNALEKIYSRNEQLPHLPNIAPPDTTANQDYSLNNELTKFTNILKSVIKGQSHVVQTLTQLYARKLFYGYRAEPAFLWFLGPPGTGKDTAIRGYLQAVNNNDPNAYIKHMYRVAPIRNQAEIWSLLGSSTGYKGSDNFPPYLKFLVEHSGGKYSIEEVPSNGREKPEYKIVENSHWREGEVLDGYYSPDQGSVYFDEFHDWSAAAKNALVKKAAEYGGYWAVNNPNGGVSEIYVPINLVASSNDGLELVTSREKNGQRFGKPLTYQQMKQRTDRVRNDPSALRKSILSRNQENSIEDAKGTSEELLNRVPDDYLLLFDPLSPEQLKEVAETKLMKLRTDIAKSKTGFNHIDLSWTPSVINFIQEYHYVAEDQARPIENRVRSLIEATIISAVTKDLIKPNAPTKVNIDVVKQSDNTWHMTFAVNNSTQTSFSPDQLFDLPILRTENDRFRQPISDERIDQLAKIGPALNAGIVGQDHAKQKIAKAIILSEEGRTGMLSEDEATENARTFMLLGPSSVGKTETAKVIAEILHGDRSALINLQCTGIQTVEQMHRFIFGHKSPDGTVTPSDFMKHFDRNSGRIVVALDEIANAPKDVLNALYDVLREPVVTLFADGKSRVMSNVTLVLTGNASQEILAQLPKDLPEDTLRETWGDIYDRLESDPIFRRKILEKYFTSPFIARVGEERIFFYKPLNHAEVRTLTQMKLEQLFDRLEATPTNRGWPVRFADRANYMHALEALDKHGFKIHEQGASIDNYIFEVFGKELHATLLLNKIPNNEAVTVSLDKIIVANENSSTARHQLLFKLKTASNKYLEFKIDGKPAWYSPKTQKSDTLLTSGHEVGHTIVSAALLSDFQVQRSVKILPGLTEQSGEWVYYAGISKSARILQAEITFDYIMRQAAILLAGTVAENLIVEGGINSAGRSNDIQRATALFEKAILEYGMSEKFGKVVRSKDQLSSEESKILHDEIRLYMEQAEVMARKAILANREAYTQLTNQLALKGELNASEIQDILDSEGLVREKDSFYSLQAKLNSFFFNKKTFKNRPSLKYAFVKWLGLIDPQEVVDINKIVSDKIKKQLDAVQLPDNLSIVGRAERRKKSACLLALSN